MKSKKHNTRRSFIKKSLAASSIFVVPRHVLGGKGFTPPSDKLNLAAIGSGGKGHSDILYSSVNGRENVVSLCDVDFSGSARETVKKFPKAKLYADFRKMLDKEKNIDAVTISTPDHVHAPAAVYAMNRGIHVYVQKPITHNIREARKLTELAREKRIVYEKPQQHKFNALQMELKNFIESNKKISKPIVSGKDGREALNLAITIQKKIEED